MVERQKLTISPSGQVCLNEREFHTAFLNEKNEIEIILVRFRKKSVNHRGNTNSVLINQTMYDFDTYKNYMSFDEDKKVLNMFKIN